MSQRTFEIYEPPERPHPDDPGPVLPARGRPPVLRSERTPSCTLAGCGGGSATDTFLVATVVCVAIWLVVGGGYFWPIWVMLGTGVPALLALTGRRR
ncbi:MAG TPA: hypothetical protein VD859_05110 [Nocardioides sp.]|nr:hypothetical protein [Nocardioides sp.]